MFHGLAPRQARRTHGSCHQSRRPPPPPRPRPDAGRCSHASDPPCLPPLTRHSPAATTSRQRVGSHASRRHSAARPSPAARLGRASLAPPQSRRRWHVNPRHKRGSKLPLCVKTLLYTDLDNLCEALLCKTPPQKIWSSSALRLAISITGN